MSTYTYQVGRPGGSILTFNLSTAEQGVVLDIRRPSKSQAYEHRVTTHCTLLGTERDQYSICRAVGVMFRLAPGFGVVVGAHPQIKVKHILTGCLVLDARNTNDKTFLSVTKFYRKLGDWLNPHQDHVVSWEFGQALRMLD